ncbi:helix-turn-helix transcriptional regulator [Asanoa sp. NPDC050611]|uniref:PadR family transcriptional regulator n=1 Tax=Asanoa sp. NPDC050611 TaxID=3157098 RepID=UPI0033DE63D1
MDDGALQRLEGDLRRGVLVLAVLSGLRTRQYGYSLRQVLADAGLPIEEGTLYPLLRRLETQGVLESAWNTDGASPRRYYWLSPDGHRLFAAMTESWRRQVDVLTTLLD